MIIKCRICAGEGRIVVDLFGMGTKPCPACRGAGEIDLQVPEERLTTCKYCAGRGVIRESFFVQDVNLCPTCNGLGLVERPVIGKESVGPQVKTPVATKRPDEFAFDIAISFAGEDREIIRSYADGLVKRKVRLFYADFEQVDLWGADLYESLDSIYRLKAKYCVIFLSKHYAGKIWTTHERRAAQARAVQENREYILPVRLDSTDIPGISPTIGYLNFQKIGVNGLLEATLKKLGV